MIHLCLVIIGFLILMLTCGALVPPWNNRGVGIAISVEPIPAFNPNDTSRHRFGALEFRGGLILASSNESFGGFSALSIESDGARFIALTDHASWLRGRIVYSRKSPARIADAFIEPVRDADGKPAGRWDTESLAEDGNRLYVGVERINRILCFRYDSKYFPVFSEWVAAPAEVSTLPFNQGLEAMAYVPKKHVLGGTLIALSEGGLDKHGYIEAFLIGGPTPGAFAVKRTQEYDISDAALLPDGSLLILERRFTALSGVSMRIRRIPLKEIKPHAVVDGPAIIEADSRCQIDNMEALSVHRLSSGEIVLTLMSDDNFSPLQRTLLIQFTLVEN